MAIVASWLILKLLVNGYQANLVVALRNDELIKVAILAFTNTHHIKTVHYGRNLMRTSRPNSLHHSLEGSGTVSLHFVGDSIKAKPLAYRAIRP